MEDFPIAKKPYSAEILTLRNAIDDQKRKLPEAFEVCFYGGDGRRSAFCDQRVGVADDIDVVNTISLVLQVADEGDRGKIVGADDTAVSLFL